jgi:hypothetical protein
MYWLEYDIGIVWKFGTNTFGLNVHVNYVAYVETPQSIVFCVLTRETYSVTTLATWTVTLTIKTLFYGAVLSTRSGLFGVIKSYICIIYMASVSPFLDKNSWWSLKYYYGSCANLTSEWLHCKLQTRPVVREVALHEETRNCQSKETLKSGHGPQRGTRHREELADWPSGAKYNFSFNYQSWYLCTSVSMLYIKWCIYKFTLPNF